MDGLISFLVKKIKRFTLITKIFIIYENFDAIKLSIKK